MSDLHHSGHVITVNFIDTHDMSYRNGNIYWNPTSGLVVGDRQRRTMDVQSAAIGLAHEMGHALQHIDGTAARLWNETVSSPPPTLMMLREYSRLLEEDVLERFEIPIARELVEPRRYNYFHTAGSVDTNSPTDWGIVEISFWDWHVLAIFDGGRSWDQHGIFTNLNN